MLDYQLYCYKEKWIMDEVYKVSQMASSKLTNTARLESETLNYVGKYLAKNPENRKRKGFIRRLIHQSYQTQLRRNKRELALSFAEVGQEDDDGESLEFVPIDVLANVEAEVIGVNETIALLAQDDRRRELILNAWADGFTNDKELSYTLARVFGGQSETHRKFIGRFKIECRQQLIAEAI